jgi:hypothetical protein
MALEGEGGPANPIEAYTWLELYRRGLERSASTGEVKRSLALATLAQEKVSGRLTPDQLKTALMDADAWPNSSPTTQKVVEMLAKVNTVAEYAGFCRDFSDLNEGFRSVSYRIRDRTSMVIRKSCLDA